MRLKKTEKIVLIALCILLAGIFLFPVKLPFNLQIQGKIIPLQEYYIIQDGNGSVFAVQNNHLLNSVIHTRTFVAERGDVVEIQFLPTFLVGSFAKENELIAVIKSNEIERQMAKLERQIAKSKSDLAVFTSGSKKALIEEAEKRLSLTQVILDQALKEYSRKEALYKSNFLSLEDFEIVQSDLGVKKIDVQIQEAALKNLLTGAKQEELQRIENEISGFEQEINILTERKKLLELRMPFSGQIINNTATDTIAFIADTSRIVILPIPLKHFYRININQFIQLNVNDKIISGQIIQKSPGTTRINQENVFLVFARLKKTDVLSPLYSIWEGHIECEGMTPLQYLIYFMNFILG